MKRRGSQGGFTLIEVLVAVVIFSIGMLGLAGLQLLSFQQNHSAYLRSVATVQAYDMADRMRANRTAVGNGDYDNPTSTQDGSCLTTTGCSSQAMAQHDAFEWQQTLGGSLPSGQGTVCIDSSPDDGIPGTPACDGTGNVYAIKVWWVDDRTRSNPTNNLHRFVTELQP